MIKSFNDLEFNEEILKQYLKTLESPAEHSKKVNSPKYLIIDWKGADLSKFDINMINKDDICDLLCYPKYINNRELLGMLYKKIELPSQEYLWGRLVDDERFISHEFYLTNTYEENLDIYYNKLIKRVLVD